MFESDVRQTFSLPYQGDMHSVLTKNCEKLSCTEGNQVRESMIWYNSLFVLNLALVTLLITREELG